MFRIGPRKGIIFKDITPLLANSKWLSTAIILMAEDIDMEGIDAVVGIDAESFIQTRKMVLLK